MYYIKYGQQIIMNLIIIESIQTKIYQRFKEFYFHFCTYICLIYLMVRKWIQHDTSLHWIIMMKIYASQVSIPLSSPPDVLHNALRKFWSIKTIKLNLTNSMQNASYIRNCSVQLYLIPLQLLFYLATVFFSNIITFGDMIIVIRKGQ